MNKEAWDWINFSGAETFDTNLEIRIKSLQPQRIWRGCCLSPPVARFDWSFTTGSDAYSLVVIYGPDWFSLVGTTSNWKRSMRSTRMSWNVCKNNFVVNVPVAKTTGHTTSMKPLKYGESHRNGLKRKSTEFGRRKRPSGKSL